MSSRFISPKVKLMDRLPSNYRLSSRLMEISVLKHLSMRLSVFLEYSLWEIAAL